MLNVCYTFKLVLIGFMSINVHGTIKTAGLELWLGAKVETRRF